MYDVTSSISHISSNPCMGSIMVYIIFWLLLTSVGSTLGRNVPESPRNKSLTLAILAPARIMQRSVASFSVAVEEVERRQILPGYTINWKFWDTNCNPFQGKTDSVKMCNIVKCISKRFPRWDLLYYVNTSNAFQYTMQLIQYCHFYGISRGS